MDSLLRRWVGHLCLHSSSSIAAGIRRSSKVDTVREEATMEEVEGMDATMAKTTAIEDTIVEGMAMGIKVGEEAVTAVEDGTRGYRDVQTLSAVHFALETRYLKKNEPVGLCCVAAIRFY